MDLNLIIIMVAIACFINITALVILYFEIRKYQRHEKNILAGTIELINKLDSIKEKLEGGMKMDEGLKKIGKYLGRKIDDLANRMTEDKEELAEKIEALELSFLEKEEEKEEAEGEEDDFSEEEDAAEEEGEDEFEDDDYKGERKVSTKEEKEPNEELAELDEKHGKPKKKGLFGRKKK